MDYLLIALILIMAIVVVVLIAKSISLHKFKCKHCSNEFNIKWPKIIITEHSGR